MNSADLLSEELGAPRSEGPTSGNGSSPGLVRTARFGDIKLALPPREDLRALIDPQGVLLQTATPDPRCCGCGGCFNK